MLSGRQLGIGMSRHSTKVSPKCIRNVFPSALDVKCMKADKIFPVNKLQSRLQNFFYTSKYDLPLFIKNANPLGD